MSGLIVFVLFVGLVVFGIIADNKSDKKEKAKNEEDADTWLNLELKQPRYKVVVVTKNAKTYESAPFTPYYEIIHFFHWTFWNYPSKNLAKDKIEKSFKAGRYFYEQTDTYIPMCDIETINVVEASNA